MAGADTWVKNHMIMQHRTNEKKKKKIN